MTRIFMPKYGIINERRHQLHEVIRLSGMNMIINDLYMPLIIKVASIPKERMQVYFIDNEDYFKRKDLLLDKNNKLLKDNDERMIFFTKGVIETVKKLNWTPDIINLHGWFTSLFPLYIKKLYSDDPIFDRCKIISSIYSKAFNGNLSKALPKKIQFDGIQDDLSSISDPDYYSLTELMIQYSDSVILSSENTEKEITTLIKKIQGDCLSYKDSLSDEKLLDFLLKIQINVFKKINLLIPILILVFTSSCNKDYYSVGIELYDNQFSDLKSKIFPVFSYQESLDKVQTNNLSSLHLGRYNDNFFGEINSSFISQLNISSIGDFGDFSQEQENEGSLTDIRVMVEDEQITSVYLDLPFYNNTNDSDNDGVIDIYDVDPNNSLSDSDTDGLSDLEELRLGTNPLNPDTDNDGIIDSQDNETIGYNPDSQVYEIDSIFGNRNGEFDLKVFELTYYLNDLDPSNNFESLKEYFSNDDFYQEGFYGETLHDDKVKLDFNEISVFYNEDDPATEDVNELNEVNYFETLNQSSVRYRLFSTINY